MDFLFQTWPEIPYTICDEGGCRASQPSLQYDAKPRPLAEIHGLPEIHIPNDERERKGVVFDAPYFDNQRRYG